MKTIRRSQDRGQANFGWLQSQHSFSFGRYLDPDHMGFGPLRVINEDRVAPGAGFDTHGHANMEIISIVLEGALEHKDSMGEAAIIRPGDVQIMSAGTGVRHSEFNASKSDPVHFLQIWVVPEADGLTPSYQQVDIPLSERDGRLRLLGSRDGRDGSVVIQRDVDLFGARLRRGEVIEHLVGEGRGVWLQLIRGSLSIGGEELRAGDGVSVRDEAQFRVKATGDAEFLAFDMAL